MTARPVRFGDGWRAACTPCGWTRGHQEAKATVHRWVDTHNRTDHAPTPTDREAVLAALTVVENEIHEDCWQQGEQWFEDCLRCRLRKLLRTALGEAA